MEETIINEELTGIEKNPPMDKKVFEIEVDNSTLMTWLNDLAPHIPGDATNDDLCRFIRSAFVLVGGSALRTDNAVLAVWKPLPRFLELFPALKAGNLNFRSLNDILDVKVGVGNESHHN